MSEVVIERLQRTEDAAQAARWWWREWGAEEAQPLTHYQNLAHASLSASPLPYVVVARRGDRLLGTASIVRADLPMFPELSPWLANVYVEPDARGHGLGTRLAEAASSYGFRYAESLYLYTHNAQSLYERLGWRVLQHARHAGRDIVIMSRRRP